MHAGPPLYPRQSSLGVFRWYSWTALPAGPRGAKHVPKESHVEAGPFQINCKECPGSKLLLSPEAVHRA